MKAPEGYESDLSGYGPVLHDPYCGEPIGWGFVVMRHLGDERFEALKRHGRMHCLNPRGGVGAWVLITRTLGEQEAVERYGARAIELGPKGGFRSVTYGTKRFVHRLMAPPRKGA